MGAYSYVAGGQDWERNVRRRVEQRLAPPPRRDSHPVSYIHMLQRTAGNRAVNQFLRDYQAHRTVASAGATALQRCAACAAQGHSPDLLNEQPQERLGPARAWSLLQRDDEDTDDDTNGQTASDNSNDTQSSDPSAAESSDTNDSESTDTQSNDTSADQSADNASGNGADNEDDELLQMHNCDLAAARPTVEREAEGSSCSCGCGGACQRTSKEPAAAAAVGPHATADSDRDGPHAGSATIVCNGSGGYRVDLGGWASAPCGIVGCIRQHEQSHISDWEGRFPQGCKNGDGTPKADGTACPTGGDGYDAFLKRSECTAYGVEQPCEEALVASASGDCRSKVQNVLDDTKRQKTRFCS
jgi:hypothetical protein